MTHYWLLLIFVLWSLFHQDHLKYNFLLTILFALSCIIYPVKPKLWFSLNKNIRQSASLLLNGAPHVYNEIWFHQFIKKITSNKNLIYWFRLNLCDFKNNNQKLLNQLRNSNKNKRNFFKTLQIASQMISSVNIVKIFYIKIKSSEIDKLNFHKILALRSP